MNLPPNPVMRDATPIDANAVLRERGPAALREILDVAPPPIRLVPSAKSGLEVVCMADVRPVRSNGCGRTGLPSGRFGARW